MRDGLVQKGKDTEVNNDYIITSRYGCRGMGKFGVEV